MILFFAVLLPLPSPAQKAAAPGTARAQRDQHEKSLEERFRKLGKALDELHAKAERMTKEARKEIDRYLADAEKKRKEVARKFERMKTEGKKRRDKLIDEMNKAVEEFEKAFERAKARFQQDTGQEAGR